MAVKLLCALAFASVLLACSTPRRSYVTHPPSGAIVGVPDIKPY